MIRKSLATAMLYGLLNVYGISVSKAETPGIPLTEMKKKLSISAPKRHSITLMASLSNTGINPFTLQVSPSLRCVYENGETINTPIAIRYQYRMKRGNRLGVDYQICTVQLVFIRNTKQIILVSEVPWCQPLVPIYKESIFTIPKPSISNC